MTTDNDLDNRNGVILIFRSSSFVLCGFYLLADGTLLITTTGMFSVSLHDVVQCSVCVMNIG